MPELTDAQQRILDEVRAAGAEGRKYNGRVKRPIDALVAAGFVNADYDMRAQAKGGGIELVWSITVTPKEGDR